MKPVPSAQGPEMSSPAPDPSRVRGVMTTQPLVVHPQDDAESLLARFESQDFNALPVVEPVHHLVGMVTKLSLLRLLRGIGAKRTIDDPAPALLRVRDVMDTRNVWVELEDGLDVVVRQMTRHHVRTVPLIERSGGRHRLVGVVTRGDLMRGLSRPPGRPQQPGSLAERPGGGRDTDPTGGH